MVGTLHERMVSDGVVLGPEDWMDTTEPLDPVLGRCAWAGASGPRPDPLMTSYHDDEWGRPTTDDVELFERLVLESFQAGLSWSTILRKRESFRTAFRGFDPATVAAFDDQDRARLMNDAGIVRNRAKVEAAIRNALAYGAICREFGGFDAYLRTIIREPARPLPATATMADIPSITAASSALSAELQARDFKFVGSTIIYAFMQSVGLVDDHLPGCFRYRA
jgi:DNA-3-methyladenine glycosylase I